MTVIDRLFSPLSLGGLTLRNRMAMAPLSRHRARIDGTPTRLMADYYAQRASAGLIVAEATAVSAMGQGYMLTPGIYSDAHVEGWRMVTDAVHAAGGAIVLQLTHAGRMSDPLILPDGATPVAPSAVQPDPLARHYTHTCPRPKRAYGTPHAMSVDEIRATIADFAIAAGRARDAGFDGVEIHGATGYLPMQFLCTNTNLRDDAYGGDIARRARFLLECVAAMQAATSNRFVSAKLGPGWTWHDVFDEDPAATAVHVADALSAMDIGYLQIGNFGQHWDVYGTVRKAFRGPLMGVKGFSRTEAADAIASGLLDMVAFGQAWIANPDLVARFRDGLPLTPPDSASFYTQGAEGYTDYPTHADSDPAATVPVDSVFGASVSGAARPKAA